MSTLVVTRGLPGSGKTTWARAWVGEQDEYGRRPHHRERVRVNRDDMRFMLFGRYWPVPEDAVTYAQVSAVAGLLMRDRDVVVDDTNLRAGDIARWREAARAAGAEFEVNDTFLGVPVEECIRRDRQRDRSVGRDVILAMMRRFEEGDHLPGERQVLDRMGRS